ncbi:capsid maturation protease [Pteropodid alphaherpesvirus 1]|uniref:Capsid scaffolding protein n=1 Tax=Pteropodid alphaherpesvirus 1 TaxID=1343901 RepID=A0A060Q4Z1_9ALPH|nr:capsid maturation protease [Pteropodid alphaherpesvirus 1]BAP00705.1 capsid maturation protease [Pteropodid alphaherpesvirus 1]
MSLEEPPSSDAPRTAIPIYVAGFLALYNGGDSGELVLTADAVESALPPANPLPINVDHRAQSEVGRVLTIVNDPRGPFFVGLIACVSLEEVLEQAASAAIFERRGPPLTREERLLYLITNYLPSVSLSTRRFAEDQRPDATLFAHVALCAIGRRLGTIVTYDVSLEAAMAPFRHLAPASRERARREAAEAELALAGRAWAPSHEALTRTLLSTAVNNMMLRDRWSLVAERRRQAGIAGHTYLQASEKFQVWGAELDLLDADAYKKPPITSPHSAQALDVPAPPPGSPLPASLHTTPSELPVMNPPAPPAPKAPGDGNYLWIPASHYSQLVANQTTVSSAPAFGMPPVPPHLPYGQAHGVHAPYPPPYGGGVYPGVIMPGPSPLEAQIAALVGAITADRKSSATGGDSSLRGSHKRRRCDLELSEYEDEDRDAPYYPGEAVPSRAPDARRQLRQAPSPNATISALVGAVTSLQQELTHLRSYPPAARYSVPPAGAYGMPGDVGKLPPPHSSGQHSTLQASYNPCLSQFPLHLHPAVAQPLQPQALAAQPGPAPAPLAAPAHVPMAAPAGAPAGPPQVQANPPLAIPNPVAADVSEQDAAAVVNASSAAHVDVDVGRASELFISQMMSGR